MSCNELAPNSPGRILAAQRINRKLQILQGWVAKGIPWKTHDASGDFIHDAHDERVLDYFPHHVKDFSEWTGSQNCAAVRTTELIGIERCSRTTLSWVGCHVDLRKALEKAFADLEVVAADQLARNNKATLLKKQEDEITFYKKVVKQQEQDVVQLSRKATLATTKYRKAQDTYRSNLKQWRAERRALEERISELTQKLRKVTSLRAR